MISKNTRDRLAENGRIRVTLSPYTFVRTTVMTSKLLTEQDYRKLLKLELPEIVQFLEESTYKKEIDELASTESGLQLIEHSVQRNFWRAVDKLRRIADDDMRFFIDVYVWRNDIENIKTLIRGKRANEDVTRLRNLFLPGTITKDELAPGKNMSPGWVKAKNICVIAKGAIIVASDLADEITPCNSPCWLSAADLLISPCKAGVTTAPSEVSGTNPKATQPLVTSASTTKAEKLKQIP